jgi:hypothetical protein
MEAGGQICACPPSTYTSLPVMKLLSSDARNRAAAAVSSGSPIRPRGIVSIRALAISSSKLPCWQVTYSNNTAVPSRSPRATLLWYARAAHPRRFCCWRVSGLPREPQVPSSCFC